MNPLSPTFDPDTVALMVRVCDAAWNELQSRDSFVAPSKETDLHSLLAQRVKLGVLSGERNPDKLRQLALIGMDGHAVSSLPITGSGEAGS